MYFLNYMKSVIGIQLYTAEFLRELLKMVVVVCFFFFSAM